MLPILPPPTATEAKVHAVLRTATALFSAVSVADRNRVRRHERWQDTCLLWPVPEPYELYLYRHEYRYRYRLSDTDHVIPKPHERQLLVCHGHAFSVGDSCGALVRFSTSRSRMSPRPSVTKGKRGHGRVPTVRYPFDFL